MINLTLACSSSSTARVWSKCGNCQCRIGPGRRYHIVRYPDGLLKPFCSACVAEILPAQENAPTAPGSGHTGAVNTECEVNNKNNQGEAPAAGEFGPICWTLDDLEVTWKELDKSAVMALFSPVDLPETEWQDLPRGRNGYRTGVVRGFIRIYWDGGADMGVHVQCSGQGCRQLEAEGIVNLGNGGWEAFLSSLRKLDATFARTDVACDDREGLLQAEKIESAIAQPEKGGAVALVTRFRFAPTVVKTDLRTGKPATGWSRYLGTGKSRLRVRMYDKQAETIEKGGADPGPWMRVELQARDERADWLVKEICQDGGRAIGAALLNYVDFKETDDTDTNRSRWASCDWWVAFVGTLEKRKATTTGIVHTVEQTAAWVERQVAPALAFILHAPGFGLDHLLELLPKGTQRLQSWHIHALQGLGVQIGSLTEKDRELAAPGAVPQDREKPVLAYTPTFNLGFGVL